MHTEINEKQKTFKPLMDDLMFKETYGNPKNIKFLEYLLESYYGVNVNINMYKKGKISMYKKGNIIHTSK